MDATVQPKIQSTVDVLLAIGWLTWLVAWLPDLWWPHNDSAGESLNPQENGRVFMESRSYFKSRVDLFREW